MGSFACFCDGPRLPRRVLGASSLARQVRFDVAASGLLAALAVLTAWIVVDANFSIGSYSWNIMRRDSTEASGGSSFFHLDSGLESVYLVGESLRWRSWSARGWGLVGLTSVIVACAGAMLFGLVAAWRSVRRWVVAAAALVWGLGLFFGFDWLSWTGACWRVSQELPRFQAVGWSLAEHWPEPSAETPYRRVAVPGLRNVHVRQGGAGNNLRVLDDFLKKPLCEGFGFTIERGIDPPIIRIEVSSGYQLEYHVVGTFPADILTEYDGRMFPRRIARLQRDWYLVEYGSHPVEEP